MTSVHQAFAAVMKDVRSIEKSERNQQQGFSFRGIDSTMQAVGPALREHGVSIIPTATDFRSETYQTRSGTQMQNVIVTMKFTVFGPEGDSFEGVSLGQSADAGDKAVTKAQSVALRTFLLQSLMVPTGDPDPDASSHERAIQAPPPPTELDHALGELDDAVAALGLETGKVAAQFFSMHKKPPRQTSAKVVREFIELLHNEAEKTAS